MTAPDLSELPLDAQFLIAATVLNAAAEPWPHLAHLATLHLPPSLLPPPPPLPTLDAGEQRADQAIALLDDLSANAAASHAISPNEELEDISTPALKLLLLPYLHATAHAAWQGDPGIRLRHLVAATDHLSAFFAGADRARLLKGDDRTRALPDDDDDGNGERESAVRRRNATANSQLGGAAGGAAAAREAKIARFKAERAASRKLDGLIAQARRETESGCEDAARDAAVAMVESAVRRGLDMRSGLATEMQLLGWAERQRARGVDPGDKARAVSARQAVPPPVPGMPQSFRIVNEREEERAKVFRPSHSLPTYTIEEWGRIEAEMLARKEAEKRDKEGIEARRKEEEDSDADDAVDKDTIEKRRWDNWKDEHNRGSGNTTR